MSFASQENIKALIEGLLEAVWPETGAGCLQTPFPRITYAEAMSQYGIDKPDTRFDMKVRFCFHYNHINESFIFNSYII